MEASPGFLGRSYKDRASVWESCLWETTAPLVSQVSDVVSPLIFTDALEDQLSHLCPIWG